MGKEPADLETELDVKGEETVVEPDITEPEPERAAPAPALTAADIAAAVAAVVAPRGGLSPEQQEQEWLRLEAESGQTRQQIVFNDNARRQANLRDNLPMYERAGAADAKDELGDRADLLPEVQALMSKHPEAVRANPQAWKDAAYLVLGKHARDKKPAKKPAEGEPGKVLGGAGGKMNTGLTEGGRGAGGKPAGAKKTYSELEQRIIDTTCGGDAEKYEHYRSKESTRPRDVKTEGTNRADIAMQNLTRGAKV